MPYANRDEQLAYLRDRRERLRTGTAAPGAGRPQEGCHLSHAQWQSVQAHLDRLRAVPTRGDPQTLVQVQRDIIRTLQALLETLAPHASSPPVPTVLDPSPRIQGADHAP